MRKIRWSVCVLVALMCATPMAGRSQSDDKPIRVSSDTTVSAMLLREQIEDSITSAQLEDKATVSIYILDSRTGKPIIDRFGEKAFPPASVNKLMTTAVSLSLLGPDYRLNTDIYRVGSVLPDGTLQGDIVVVGGGDPSVSGRFEQDKTSVTEELKRWADALTSQGIRKINGNLIADDRIFDREYFHKNWYPMERGEWYEAEIWGLSFNEGCVDLDISSKDMLPGDQPKITLNPATTYAKIYNKLTVVGKGRTAGREYLREEKSSDVVASGTMTYDSTKIDSVSVHCGPIWLLHSWRDVLSSRSIEVTGDLVLADPQEICPQTAGGILVHRRLSPPVSELINVVNRVSQNFYADTLCKYLGSKFRSSGSWSAGTAVVREWLRSREIWCEGLAIVDGSGLSEQNRVSARTMCELIAVMDNGPYSVQWRDSFPQGGIRGSLRSRFIGSPEIKAKVHRIYGKTGYIDGVRSLAGILLTSDGAPVYYMVNVNGSERPAQTQLDLIDQIVTLTIKSLD